MLRGHPVGSRIPGMAPPHDVSRRRAAVTSAAWALRTYGVSTAILIGVGAAAIATSVPVAWLGTPGAPRLRLPSVAAVDLGIPYSRLAWGPASAQWGALVSLARVAFALAAAIAGVAIVTILAVAVIRAVARRREMMVRRAVGATRGTLRGGVLLEGVALSGAATLVGAIVAVAAWQALAASWPGTIVTRLPWPALVIGCAVAGAIAVGTYIPATWIPRTPHVSRRSAIPHGLVVPAGQLGVSLTILILAGSLAHHAAGMSRARDQAAASTGTVFDIRQSGPLSQRGLTYAALLGHLGTEPAIRMVSLTSPGVLFGVNPVDFVTTDCGRCSQGGLLLRFRIVPAALGAISVDTFRALGVRLLRGRGFANSDTWDAPRVAIVNEALATAHFEDGLAVGRRILLGSGAGQHWFTVVGVVQDRRPVAMGGAFQPPFSVYVSVLQQPPQEAELLVRSRPAGNDWRARTTAEIESSGGGRLSVARSASEVARRDEAAAPVRWFARVARIEGRVVLLIATFGLFAVMDLWVSALLPELAVRRSVGARRRQVLGHVLGRAALVAGGGVALGLWLTEMTAGAVTGAFGTGSGPTAGLILRSAVLLVTAAIAGAWLPAWRAARAAPAASLAQLES